MNGHIVRSIQAKHIRILIDIIPSLSSQSEGAKNTLINYTRIYVLFISSF